MSTVDDADQEITETEEAAPYRPTTGIARRFQSGHGARPRGAQCPVALAGEKRSVAVAQVPRSPPDVDAIPVTGLLHHRLDESLHSGFHRAWRCIVHYGAGGTHHRVPAARRAGEQPQCERRAGSQLSPGGSQPTPAAVRLPVARIAHEPGASIVRHGPTRWDGGRGGRLCRPNANPHGGQLQRRAAATRHADGCPGCHDRAIRQSGVPANDPESTARWSTGGGGDPGADGHGGRG